MKFRNMAVAVTAALLALPMPAEAGGLRGSPTSMREQHAVAVERDLEFISDADEVKSLVGKGELEEIQSNPDFRLSGVSFPYALPEVKLFLERIGRQYRDANGTQLVVTSLTRPESAQPRNAHELSVHPAGMAVDFRVPQNAKARAWLERVLLQLENSAVLDVTRERNPPHYHVAVFPAAYGAYAQQRAAVEKAAPAEPVVPLVSVAPEPMTLTAPALPATPSSGPPSLLLVVIGMCAVAVTALTTRRYAVR